MVGLPASRPKARDSAPWANADSGLWDWAGGKSNAERVRGSCWRERRSDEYVWYESCGILE